MADDHDSFHRVERFLVRLTLLLLLLLTIIRVVFPEFKMTFEDLFYISPARKDTAPK